MQYKLQRDKIILNIKHKRDALIESTAKGRSKIIVIILYYFPDSQLNSIHLIKVNILFPSHL